MSDLFKILICDDSPIFQEHMKRSLGAHYQCIGALNGDEALKIIKQQSIDLVLLDIQLRTPDEGFRYIPLLLSADPELTIVMISHTTDFRAFREALRLGAVDFIAKDFSLDQVLHIIQQALHRRTLVKQKGQKEFETLTHQRRNVLFGKSKALEELRRQIDKIRAGSANVLIFGETGTGKELVARQLRKTSPNHELEPFVAIDSATIQNSMAESILFGHDKGAFTGADRSTKGIFEEAHLGVVYFDEIANMPLDIQPKLLRVLQEKEVRRLGSSRAIPLQFRVIAASNRDLEQLTKEGLFKADLFQRLNVIPIYVPSLRERTEDIPLLVEHFLRKHPSAVIPAITVSEDAMEALCLYSWPGNVRELENMIAYVVTMTEGSRIEVGDLPPKIRCCARKWTQADQLTASEDNFYTRVETYERTILAQTYTEYDGNISKVAVNLKMDRSHLYRKLKEYGILINR